MCPTRQSVASRKLSCSFNHGSSTCTPVPVATSIVSMFCATATFREPGFFEVRLVSLYQMSQPWCRRFVQFDRIVLTAMFQRSRHPLRPLNAQYPLKPEKASILDSQMFFLGRISDFDTDHKIEFRQLRHSTADKFSVCCCFGTTGP